MRKNSHNLRLQLDAREPMWTPCISVISKEGHTQQSVYKLRKDLPFDTTVRMRIYAIRGKRGTLYRLGQPSSDPNVIVTPNGHLLHRAYLESELQMGEWLVEDFLKATLYEANLMSRIHGLYVKNGKKLIVGIHRGDIHLHYSGFLYLNDAGNLAIKDVETKANAKNSHELCAFVGVKQADKEAVVEGFKSYLQRISAPPKGAVKARVPNKGKR